MATIPYSVSPWIFIVLFSTFPAEALAESHQAFEVIGAQTFELVNLIFSRQTGFSTTSILVLI